MTMSFVVDEAEEYRRVHNLMIQPNAIFVFGSNLGGIHGAGAAKDAYQKYGAQMRCGMGLQGRSYAIPTKDASFNVLPLLDIGWYVASFLDFAFHRPDLTFAVTRIGCGLRDVEVAPLFAMAPEHCVLPVHWRDIISGGDFMNRCQCYLDTGGVHLCVDHRVRHIHVWETVVTTGGVTYRCIFCGEVREQPFITWGDVHEKETE